MTRRASAFPLVLLIVACGFAPAADAPPAKTGETVFTDQEWANAQRTRPAEQASPVAAIAQLGIALAIVLGVVIAAGWALKRANLRRFTTGGRGKHLTLIETLALAPRRAVSLVRIGEQVLVVGHAEHGMTHLATLPAATIDAAPIAGADPAVAVPAPSLAPAAAGRDPHAFARLVDALTGRR